MNHVNGAVPSPFQPMKRVSREKLDKIWEMLETETGFKGFILIVSADTLPCAEEKAGLDCQGHDSMVYNHGIEGNYVRGALEAVLAEAERQGK